MMFLGPLLKKAVIKSLILICLAKHFIYVAIDVYNSLKKKIQIKSSCILAVNQDQLPEDQQWGCPC